MAVRDSKDSVQSAFDSLQHVFNVYFNAKAHESNRYPLGHPSRVEADLRETEKAHLNLLQSKLHATIAQELLKSLATSSAESNRLGNKLFWLNIFVAALTAVLAVSAVIQIFK